MNMRRVLWLSALLGCFLLIAAGVQPRAQMPLTGAGRSVSNAGSPPACCVLDGITTGLKMVLSTRKLISAYAGAALQVNGAADIGFVSNSLDTATLASLCPVSCTVSKWYNQLGANDCVGTGANPTITPTTLINGKNAIAFNGTTQAYQCTGVSANPTNVSFQNAVIQVTDLTAIRDITGGSAAGTLEFRVEQTTGKISVLKATVALIGSSSGGIAAATGTIVEASYDVGTGNFAFWIDRSASGTGTNSQSFSAGTLQIGRQDIAADFMGGLFGEYIAYDVAGGVSTGNRQTIENDQHTFWGTP